MNNTTIRHRNIDPPSATSNNDNNHYPYENGKQGKNYYYFFGRRTSQDSFRLIFAGISCVLVGSYFLAALSSSSSKDDPSSLRLSYVPKPLAEDGPPADLILHGSRDVYTPCPPEYRKKAFLGTEDSHLKRAFRHEGWDVSTEESDAKAGHHHILYRHGNIKNGFEQGRPWQRYSRTPSGRYWDPKDLFNAGFRRLQQEQEQEKRVAKHTTGDNDDAKNLIYFLPETYQLEEKDDRTTFSNILTKDKAIGRHRPWVLKKVTQNNGKGIEMLPPDSSALYSAVSRSQADTDNRYVVQSYICNELTWFGGEKFDLRFYWLVASVDPLIVLYHDGYARVAGALYNESDFESTAQHLTNHAFRGEVDQDVLADALWRRVWQHYNANKRRLSSKILGGDPVVHVRNQLKEAISATAAAFKDVLTLRGPKNVTVTTENLFGFYGADFIIDEDLDVYYVEAQVTTGLGDGYDYRVELFRGLFRPMVKIVEEIAMKQETNAKGNILPIESLGDWEIVYAGDDWRYQYKGYERSKNKPGCNLKPSSFK
jgi:hypothetical protein